MPAPDHSLLTSARHLGYVPAIDGLRAVAVLGVLIFHAEPAWCPGGFAGVDVFFVISGFLITAILRRSITSGTFSLLGFYERRARRILPALVVVLLAVTAAATLILMPADLARFGNSLVGAAASVANVVFYRNANYFDPSTELMPLLHTWSLSVEEQFYVFFPLVLLAAHRVARRHVPLIIVGMLVISLLASIIATPRAPTGAFFLLPTRAWELALGAVLAWGWVPTIAHQGLRHGLGLAGLALIATSYAFIDAAHAWPGAWALVPCLGAALTIQAVISGPTLVDRLLGLPVLVGIGLISYSLYLWHWPILSLYGYMTSGMAPSLTGIAACLLASGLLAWLSWLWIERPFRNPASPNAAWGTKVVLIGSAAVLTIFAALGLAFRWSGGFPTRLPAAVVAIDSSRSDINPGRNENFIGVNMALQWSDLPQVGAKAPPSVLLIGDSHAESLFGALGEAAQRQGKRIVGCFQRGVPPTVGVGVDGAQYSHPVLLRQNVESAITHAVADPSIHTVVLAARWASYVLGDDLKGRVRFANQPPRLRSAKGENRPDKELLEQGLREATEVVLRARKRVVIIGQIPELGFNAPLALAQAKRFGRDISLIGIGQEAFLVRERVVQHIISQMPPGVELFDPAPFFLDGGIYHAGDDKVAWYIDDNHLSVTGARMPMTALGYLLWSNGNNAVRDVNRGQKSHLPSVYRGSVPVGGIDFEGSP